MILDELPNERGHRGELHPCQQVAIRLAGHLAEQTHHRGLQRHAGQIRMDEAEVLQHRPGVQVPGVGHLDLQPAAAAAEIGQPGVGEQLLAEVEGHLIGASGRAQTGESAAVRRFRHFFHPPLTLLPHCSRAAGVAAKKESRGVYPVRINRAFKRATMASA